MDYTHLNELIKLKKKGDQAKDKKNEYAHELIDLLNEEGINEISVKYLYSGFSFLGADPFFAYIKTKPQESIYDVYFQLREEKCFLRDKEISLKLVLNILALLLNELPNQVEIISDIIHICPRLTKNKDGTTRNDLEKILVKYLLMILDNSAVWPERATLKLENKDIHEFYEMLNKGLVNYNPGEQYVTINMAKLHKWLFIGPVIDEKSIESKTGDNEVTDTDSEKNNKTPRSTKIKKEEKKETDFQQPEWKKGLLAVEDSIKSLEATMRLQNDSLINANRETEKLKKQLEFDAAEYNKLNALNDDLRKSNYNYRLELNNSQQRVELIEGELIQAKQEIESRKELTEMMGKDFQKQQYAYLNRLTNELKLDFEDLMNVKDEKMTVDLGENMRLQLLGVFEILKKYGMEFSQDR